MKISKEFEVLVDSLGTYIVRQHYISKVGVPTSKDIAYCRTAQQAKEVILTRNIAKTELKDYDAVIDAIEKAKKDIAAIELKDAREAK